MAPLPDNLTDRYFLDYTSMGIVHTLMVRFPQVTLRADADTTMFNLATAFAQRMRTSDSFFRARYAESGQNFSLPTAWTPINGVMATGSVLPTDPQSTCYSIVGHDFGISVAAVYSLDTHTNTITPIPNSGGVSPANASPEIRKREVSYAHSWFENVINDMLD